MPMIDIQHISKWYGDFQVLTDCTTSIEKVMSLLFVGHLVQENQRSLKL